MAKFELAICLVEKVEHGQKLCNCVNSQIFEGYTHRRGKGGEGTFVNFLIDLNPIYVLVKLEPGSC